MAFVRAMLNACSRLGHDASAALEAVHIAPEQIANLHARITAAQMERLSERLMRELDDEALGWFSRRLPWGSYGMLARASITAPTLEVAMKRWCRHHGLLTSDIHLELCTQTDGLASIALIEPEPNPERDEETREFCHVSMLRNLLGLASWLVDSQLPLSKSEFGFKEPPHADAYTVLFPGPLEFGMERTQIFFPANYLQLPLHRDDHALRSMLRRALPLTVHAYRKDRLLTERVRQVFRTDPSAMRHAELVAERLHLSTRTLHRQLREQGTTLQTLKNSVRMELATELLQRTKMPIKQIALAVGFDNDKGFIRAFRQLTGSTPEAFRN